MYSSVLFNSQDLTTLAGVQINEVNFEKRPNRTVTRKQLALADNQKVVRTLYAERTIIISGILTGSTQDIFNTNRDSLMRYLQPQEATLRLSQSGANRDYTATVDEVSWTEEPIGGFGLFEITFICSTAYGQDTANTTALNTIMSGSSFTSTFLPISGQYTVEPVITITLGTITGGTNKFIQITNPTSGKLIKVTRTWANGDVLVIDVAAKTVKVNGTAVDFTGVLPTWEVGDTQLAYSDTLTTRSVTVNMAYKKRYL